MRRGLTVAGPGASPVPLQRAAPNCGIAPSGCHRRRWSRWARGCHAPGSRRRGGGRARAQGSRRRPLGDLAGGRLQVRSRTDLLPLSADPRRDLRGLRAPSRGRGRAAPPRPHVPSGVRGRWRDPRERRSRPGSTADDRQDVACAMPRRCRASSTTIGRSSRPSDPSCNAPSPAGATSSRPIC